MYGLITGGFETPEEAMHLGKKIMGIPIRGQYEQLSNGAALQNLNVPVLKKIDEDFSPAFYNWMQNKEIKQMDYNNTIPVILERLFEIHRTQEKGFIQEEVAYSS